jgi:phage shock protein E
MDTGTIILFAIVLIGFGLVRQYLANVRGTASPDEVRALIEAGATVVDVRTPGEYTADHYPGAINIPLNELMNRTGELGTPDSLLVLYCNSGRRSGLALKHLRNAGFEKCVNAGGLARLRSH